MRLDQANRIMLGDREVSRVYLGADLVWPSPASLFAQGEAGGWYDPSDFSTMFQDSAGTVPVTAVEQPVGRILDKSGRGFHATQATATSRPVLRQDGNGKYYLYFDGVDDGLVTNTITPGTDKVQVFAGVRKLGVVDASLVGIGTVPLADSGTFEMRVPRNLPTPDDYAWFSRGTITVGNRVAGYASPITNVLTGIGDISGDRVTLRVNGTQAAQSTLDQGAGNFLDYPLYIGRRGGASLPFNGHLYSLIVRFGSNLPIETIGQAETWINSKTGAY